MKQLIARKLSKEQVHKFCRELYGSGASDGTTVTIVSSKKTEEFTIVIAADSRTTTNYIESISQRDFGVQFR